jgi:SAM-dependent methyltransferase
MNLAKRIVNRLRRDMKKVIGPKRHCPVCNKAFKGRFNPIPDYYLENSKRTGWPYSPDDAETLSYKEFSCPFCDSMDRDRLYALYLSKSIKKDKSYKLLDIAPSKGLAVYLKARPEIKRRTADLFMEGVDDRVNIMDMKIYPDASFDIFICSHILEHVDDDRQAMRELSRILKPDGFGICMVPIITPLVDIDEDITVTDPDERWRRFGQDDHVRLYSKKDFVNRLTEVGFKVEECGAKFFSQAEMIYNGISPKSVLYIVRK